MTEILETVSNSPNQIKSPVDHFNDIVRFILQSQSVLNALSWEDNYEELPKEAVANVLWLVSDRLDDIETSVNACWEGLATPNSLGITNK